MTMQHTPALEVATIPATYRAVVYTAPNGGEVRLTSYADAHLSDEDLIAAAMREAGHACIACHPDRLRITDWTEVRGV